MSSPLAMLNSHEEVGSLPPIESFSLPPIESFLLPTIENLSLPPDESFSLPPRIVRLPPG